MTTTKLIAASLFTAASVMLVQTIPAAPTTKGEICIYTYHDANKNGVRNSGEASLPAGWQFKVKRMPSGPTKTVTTLSGGGICFGMPAPATYKVKEIVQSGWKPLSPAPKTVSLNPGQLVNVNFGNWQ